MLTKKNFIYFCFKFLTKETEDSPLTSLCLQPDVAARPWSFPTMNSASLNSKNSK